MSVSHAQPLFDVDQLWLQSHAPSYPAEPLGVMDLFAGAGGLSEGFRQAGFRVVAGSDLDPDACATYRVNFPEAETICGDIREREVRQQVTEAGRDVDVLVGGPPCQAFSQVRNHSRIIDDPRNSLYREFVAILSELQPAAFLMENVPGMAQMGVLQQVIEDLSLGTSYEVNPQVLDAADFGVPQTRKRLIFIGVRRDLGVSPLLTAKGTAATATIALVRLRPGKYEVQARGENAEEYLHALTNPETTGLVTAKQAISDLRYLRSGRRDDEMAASDLRKPESAYQKLMRTGLGEMLHNVSVPRINADTVTRLRAVTAGGNQRDLSDELKARYLSGQRWGQAKGTGALERSHFSAYRRLHPDIWGWTLNTKADSVYHYSFARSLSVREFARLQSFPDRFAFTSDPRHGKLPGRMDGGPAHSRYRQVGNAVPPLLAASLARDLARLVRAARVKAHGQ